VVYCEGALSSSESPRSGLPDSNPSTLNDSFDAVPEEESAAEPKPVREGLPRGFRMRHDAHFVDQLDGPAPSAVLRMLPLGGIDAPSCDDGPAIEALARSIRRVGMVEPLVVRRTAGRYQVIAGAKRLSAARLAQLDRVPCVVRDDLAEDAIGAVAHASVPPLAPKIDDRPSGPFSSTSRERVLDEAIASLAAARTSVELTLPRSDRLPARAAGDLVRAELLNTRLALTAMRLLSAPPFVRRTLENPRQLMDAVMGELAPIVRLSNARVTVNAAEDLPEVTVMRPIVTFALEACFCTVLTLAGDAPAPALSVSLTADPEDRTLSCSTRLDGGWLPAETAQRLADIEWSGHPAGATSAMIVAAAECVAKLHGGTLDVSTDYEGFGITLRLRGR
jgi:ParB-like nuclease family protein